MKRIIFAVAMLAGATLMAADPNPYSSYDSAMKSDPNHPMAVEWQQREAQAIAAATEPSVIAAFVADAESARALLAQVRPAYASDPLILTQIAAVTQWVMTEEPCWLCFWSPSPAAGREIWTAELKRKIAETGDEYVRTFCRQQLDLCGYCCCAAKK